MWVKLHVDVFAHPKLVKLCRLLPDLSEAAAVGHLASLWTWALVYATDGDLSRYDELDIAIASRYPGDALEFVRALTRAGFLDPDESGELSIHDWASYGGRYIENREAARQRSQNWRAARKEAKAKAATEEAEPKPKKPKQAPRTGVDLEPFYAEFWPLYPRKVGKEAAAKAWAAIDPSREQIDELIRALKAQIASDLWESGPRYIPHPATWLNGKRWLDELPSKPSREVRLQL